MQLLHFSGEERYKNKNSLFFSQSDLQIFAFSSNTNFVNEFRKRKWSFNCLFGWIMIIVISDWENLIKINTPFTWNVNSKKNQNSIVLEWKIFWILFIFILVAFYVYNHCITFSLLMINDHVISRTGAIFIYLSSSTSAVDKK